MLGPLVRFTASATPQASDLEELSEKGVLSAVKRMPYCFWPSFQSTIVTCLFSNCRSSSPFSIIWRESLMTGC